MTLGGPRAGGGHPGGRRHGGNREHRPQPGTGQGRDDRHPRRRAADRRARASLDPVHLHRVRADVLPRGRGALPVRAAGRGGRLRHARLLRPFTYAGADAGAVHPARPRAPGPRGSQGILRAVPGRLRARVRADAYRLRGPAGALPAPALVVPAGVPGRLSRLDAAGADARAGLLPDGGRRTVPAAHPCPHGDPHRGNRRACRPRGTVHPHGHPEGGSDEHPRQHRPAVQRHQHLLRQQRHHRHGRHRDSLLARRRKARPDRRLRGQAARGAAQAVPRQRVLLPAGGHRQPDPQFRPVRADRRAIHRQERPGQSGGRPRRGREDAPDSGRGGHAHLPALQPAQARPDRGPLQGERNSA